ncbi:PREDICTED: titin-like, partial [Amphimedon queenslandica]|uniref:Ig-like domain-containing protein n=1 Tax=Amphimedon queenslandica TaxID=400682 RepID=A0AAN0JTN1_AMPQE
MLFARCTILLRGSLLYKFNEKPGRRFLSLCSLSFSDPVFRCLLRGSLILYLLLLAPLIVVGNVSITSAPPRSSPAVFQAGENVTLTCSSTTNTYSWTSSFSESAVTTSNITGLFLRGANTGDHVCNSGGNTATYTISVQGTTVWYNNPPPGRLLPNNTAISVYSDVSEVRCYTGDTSTNNDATQILTPTGSSQPLTFTNREAGYLRKNGQTSINSVTNGVYTCQYTNSTGGVSYTSFAVFPRSREPSSGSSNTTSLEVQSVEYSTNNESIIVTCITTGWPATQVVWKHNNVQLSPGSGFTMNQRVMDREQCTYKNDLIVENAVNHLGTYRCEVKSLRHNNVTIDTTVGSVTVQAAGNVRVAVTTMGSQEVGESFYLNCTVNKINNVSLEIRWMKDNVTIVSDMSKGVMLGGIGEDANSVSRLLTLSPIRLSHTGQYSCDAVNGSAVDGRATIKVDIDAPYLSLSLDPSPDLSLTLGEEYTLMCAALLPDSLNSTVASITWYKDSFLFTGSGITTNLAEGTSNLNLGMVLSEEAGNYTCVANVSSSFIDTGYNLIVSNTTLITVSMPEPNSVVLALNYLSPPYYAGLRRDLQCSIDSLYIHNDPTVTVSVDILFNDTIVRSGLSSNGRKNLQQLSSNPSGGQYRKTLQFQYFVSSEDSGVYTCMVSVSSNYLSSYIVNASISRTNEYDIV